MPTKVASTSPLEMRHAPSTPPISRRPSPWHEIAHSLASVSPPSTPPITPIPPPASTPAAPSTPNYDSDSSAGASLSASVGSSLALREWERALAAPDSDVTRHALVLPPSENGSPLLLPSVPKLAAERDKEGHIEYKLKLIEPSADRFERLVTQMMWRLKQGRNEAIYELGLADDGTVIGLTRAEMDASLATLERMASEVGATVLVLKEIVLAAPPPRPDLDENGNPRRGTKGVHSSGPEMKSRRERLRVRREAEAAATAAGEVLPPPEHVSSGKLIVFSDGDSDYSGDGDGDGEGDDGVPSQRRISNHPRRISDNAIDDEPTFQLDMDRTPSSNSNSNAPKPQVDDEAALRAEAKRRKSAARREARRLDLLRGDGTSPIAEIISHAPSSPAWNLHQPVKPSSLRLARGVSDGEGSTPDDAFIDTLARPLDSLSLSFADVRSPESAPEGELICVEALVVRKNGGEFDVFDEVWGGQEDGWGLGGDE